MTSRGQRTHHIKLRIRHTQHSTTRHSWSHETGISGVVAAQPLTYTVWVFRGGAFVWRTWSGTHSIAISVSLQIVLYFHCKFLLKFTWNSLKKVLVRNQPSNECAINQSKIVLSRRRRHRSKARWFGVWNSGLAKQDLHTFATVSSSLTGVSAGWLAGWLACQWSRSQRVCFACRLRGLECSRDSNDYATLICLEFFLPSEGRLRRRPWHSESCFACVPGCSARTTV